MKSDPLKDGARQIAGILRQHGYQAYFAGGCVRDVLLQKTPKDYDIATDARPDEIMRLFRRTVAVGAAFGVVRVQWSGDREYEVATFRTDGRYVNGRHPEAVTYARTKEEDVARRDFTINALLMDPKSEEVIDLVGGQDDLGRGVIRAVGDPTKRFGEDRLRMLRAVRFAVRLGFVIDENTKHAIAHEAMHIGDVSWERIALELDGIWVSAHPGDGLRMLAELGLIRWVVSWPISEATPLLLDRLPDARVRWGLSDEDTLRVAWALLLWDAEGDRRALELRLRTFRPSKDRLRGILRLAEARPLLLDPAAFSRADRVRRMIAPECASYLALVAIVCGDDSKQLSIYQGEVEALATDPLPPLPLLTGDELIELGATPGSALGVLVRAVDDATLERMIRTKDDAKAFVREKLSSSPA